MFTALAVILCIAMVVIMTMVGLAGAVYQNGALSRVAGQPRGLDDNRLQSLASTYSDVRRRPRAMANADLR